MAKECVVKILDEVNCVLLNLHPDHLGFFNEHFARKAPNFFFNPKYKLGQWDGKIRYFHKTGKTYVNLLSEIIPKLIGLKYSIRLDDNRQVQDVTVPFIDKDFFSSIINPETGLPWVMHPYQVDLVNALIGNKGGVAIAGTGSGKTSMCAALALSYERAANFRSIIIVPDKSLTRQTRAEYAFFGLDVGQYSGEEKDIAHMHVVSTWQSLKNNPLIVQDFDMVIVDECHGIKGPVLTEILTLHAKDIPFRFGVTGTMPEEETDAMAVRIAVGDVQYIKPASELIEQGYLAHLHIDILQLEVNLTEQYNEYILELSPGSPKPTYRAFKDSYFPEWSAEKAFLQSEKKRLKWIANYLESCRDNKKGNVLCLVSSIPVGKKLAQLIPNSEFVHGVDKTEDREKVYNLFKDNDNVLVIATVHIAGTGLNIKRIFNLVFIDIGKSFIRTIQSIGRGLRKAHDKDRVLVTDICSDLKYSKRHLRDRIKYYKEAKYPFEKKVIQYTDDNIC